MTSKLRLLLLSSLICITTYAQVFNPISLNIGDPAPHLRVSEWLKGKSIAEFDRGKVYVVDLWATWCGPCIEGMPQLSALARKYRNRVEILGIDFKEKKMTSLQKVKDFVDSMGHRMDFNIATDDSDFMARAWYDASGDPGIPRSFVVNKEGRIAWIGHTAELSGILYKIVSNTWDIDKALAERNLNMRLKQLDHEANDKLNNYEGKSGENFLGDPDSALLVIDEMVKKEPKLKFAPLIAYHTFSALLKTKPAIAYEYGKQALITATYTDPPYNEVIRNIDIIADRFASPPEIYQLGAEAYQALIGRYPNHMKTPKTYLKMAEWYMRADNKSKAKQCLKSAIKLMKKSKGKYWSGFL